MAADREGTALAPGDRWGPFADDLAPGERLARLRALRAIVRLLCGPRGATAAAALLAAEARPEADPAACAAVMALEPIDRRRVLASYAALSRAGDGVSEPRRTRTRSRAPR